MTWLRAHWRPLAAALALLLAFALGRAFRPAPRIEYRERVVYREKEAAHAEQAQQATAQHDTDAASTASLAAHHRVHRHQEVHTAPDGSQVSIKDELIDDGLTLETAQEVVVELQTASLVLGARDVSREARAAREVEVVQTPEEAPRFRADFFAGLSRTGPVYGGSGAWSPGKVPILDVPVWLGVWGLTAPAGGVSVGVEW